MKLLAFLKLRPRRIRTVLQGSTALLLCLGLSGCELEDIILLVLFVKGEAKLEIRHSKVDHPKYDHVHFTSHPGKPGQTTTSLTGPGGAQTSMNAPGFAEDAVVGDLDNDGLSGDVALVMRTDNNVTVIRLVGNTLQSPVQYPTGTNPVAVAVGDVNGDHFTDLVTANAGTYLAGNFTPGSLSVLLGKGDGTFGAASTLTAGASPGDVGLGDFNGDGNLDLAVANGSNLDGTDVTNQSVIVRLGLGNGLFGPEIPVAAAQRTLALQVVDFNKNGHEDIVTTGSLLLGHGDGTFAAPVNLVPGLNPLLVKVEDLNNDGKLDIILGTVLPKLATILIGNGDGTLAPPQHYVLNASAFAVAYFDVDGDSVSDLLFTNGGDDATLMLGRGDGRFQWVQAAPTSSNLSSQTSSATGAAVADFTGDGIPDVVVANGGGIFNRVFSGSPATILPGLGGGKLGSPIAIPGQPGYSVVSGDWNGDGKPDLAFIAQGTNSPVLAVALGLGGGAFGPYTSTVLPGGSPLPSIVTAFLNHDSAPDLLVGNLAIDEVSVFLGNGNGGFTAQAPVVIGTAPVLILNASPPGIAVGDFNEDSHPDLVVAYEGEFGLLNGGMKIAFGNGDGTFQTPRILRSSVAAKGVAAADFNRDGHLDLALAMEATTFNWDVAIYLGHGDGSFAAPMPLGLTHYFLVSGVIALDADQDGKLDLVVPHGGGALGLRGLGDGTFAPVGTAPIGGYTVMAADLNQDGWPDMLAPNGFLALYINELPALGLKYPILEIGRAVSSVLLKWPAFYPDYSLQETRDLSTPFVPSSRQTITNEGFFNVTVDPTGTKSGFFQLKPK